MKSANSILAILTLFTLSFSTARDIQSTYEEAKAALLNGDYEFALDKIAVAFKQIDADPNLDPNQAFSKKLLPALEVTALNMLDISKSLEKIYNTASANLAFPDLPPTLESIKIYNQQAQRFSTEVLGKRDELLASHELDAEFRDALRKSTIATKIEELVSVTLLKKLTAKFSSIATVLIDSLKLKDTQYESAQDKLEKLKSTIASKMEIGKVQDELSRLSQERLNYVNALTQMLESESISEVEPLRQALIENQVENVFSNMVKSETRRLRTMTSIDSAGYKELEQELVRMKSYNQIFVQNLIAGDKSALLAQYQTELKSIKIKQNFNVNWWLILIFLVILVLAAIAVHYIKKTGLILTFHRKSDIQPPPNED
jgi:hypothetical protein